VVIRLNKSGILWALFFVLVFAFISCNSNSDKIDKKPEQNIDGILEISFGSRDSVTQNRVVGFYKTPQSSEPDYTVKMSAFDYNSGFDSLLSQTQTPAWLAPLEFMPTPGRVYFRCLKQKGSWYQVLTNDTVNIAYWIRKDSNIELISWLQYFQGGDYIDLGSEIRTEPRNDAPVMKRDSSCFKFETDSLVGDWIRVSTSGYCGLIGDSAEIIIEKGWSKWRKGNVILVGRGFNE